MNNDSGHFSHVTPHLAGLAGLARMSQLSLALALAVSASAIQAHDFPVTPDQKATATQVAQTGVPLADLASNAPDRYTVKSGDTLWAISGLFLKTPWRWPELWGMNLQDIKNPHRIYPGQQLVLDKANGRATLRTLRAGANDGPPTDAVRVSPRTRFESLADASIPTLAANAIESFLAEPMIVDAAAFAVAPRIVAAQEGRVLLSRGDRAYARGEYANGTAGKPLSDAKGQPLNYRVFRNATPLKDPTMGVILGYVTFALVSERWINGLIGVVGAAFALNLLITRNVVADPKPAKVAPGLFWTTVAGFTSFVSHTGGPPYQVWTLPLGLSKAVFAGTSTIAFAYVNLLKLPFYWHLGQVNTGSLKVAAMLAPVAVLAVFAGVRLVRILPDKVFFQLVVWTLLAISLKLIYSAAVA